MPFLSEELFRLNPELEKIATILDNPETLEPFVERYHKATAEAGLKNSGRPTVPLHTFAAMVLLKFMYDLPYRELSPGPGPYLLAGFLPYTRYRQSTRLLDHLQNRPLVRLGNTRGNEPSHPAASCREEEVKV